MGVNQGHKCCQSPQATEIWDRVAVSCFAWCLRACEHSGGCRVISSVAVCMPRKALELRCHKMACMMPAKAAYPHATKAWHPSVEFIAFTIC